MRPSSGVLFFLRAERVDLSEQSYATRLKANLALFLAAMFWGTTFIFQREAMDYMTPMAYSGVRFLLGAVLLLPFALRRAGNLFRTPERAPSSMRYHLVGCLISGGFIFVGLAFQQYGLVWTTAGKAGFITSLYVVLVPFIMLLIGHKILVGEILGAVLAVIGLYLLSFTGLTSLAPGDGLVLIGAFVWAGQVISLSFLSPKMDWLILGTGQALVCGILSFASAVVLGETPTLAQLSDSWICILWGGIFSVTFGFTLQVVGQKHASPAASAIILQMEAVIAAITGWLFLKEVMTPRMVLGAAVMLAGLLISQLWGIFVVKKDKTGV